MFSLPESCSPNVTRERTVGAYCIRPNIGRAQHAPTYKGPTSFVTFASLSAGSGLLIMTRIFATVAIYGQALMLLYYNATGSSFLRRSSLLVRSRCSSSEARREPFGAIGVRHLRISLRQRTSLCPLSWQSFDIVYRKVCNCGSGFPSATSRGKDSSPTV